MPGEEYPLLLFPGPTSAGRSKLTGGGQKLHLPTAERQGARIAPQLTVLKDAYEAKRLKLQEVTPLQDPELVLVLEVAGDLDRFANAVKKIPGLEWLFEWAENELAPDGDFFDLKQEAEPFDGRLYLLGTNQQAIEQLLSLWDRYQANPTAKFDVGWAPFLNLFKQLRTIRFWDVGDRVTDDARSYWQNCVAEGQETIRFEIEAWYVASLTKNEAAQVELRVLIDALGGQIVNRALIGEISYHGFLVELPREAIENILAGEVPELLMSDRVMFFRPRAQSITDGMSDSPVVVGGNTPTALELPPVVALLDGLPLQNHPQLIGCLIVDDPDNWEADYQAKDRVHGTAMASLIINGELDGVPSLAGRRLYVRPILRPDPTDTFNQRRREHTPDTVLLIDLIHRAVRRICEGEGGQGRVDSIRVINLSVGLERAFSSEMSPWARLLDWLAFKYSVLFIVSAGNYLDPLLLQTAPNSLADATPDTRSALAFSALVQSAPSKRLYSPAEATNVLTVGAIHADSSAPANSADRFDLFEFGGISPLSRIGLGFRRAVKPDILMPGGRALFRERIGAHATQSQVSAVGAGAPPGHRVAVPPLPGENLNATAYCRGTSNAAALTSRAATQIFEMIETLRPGAEDTLKPAFDAVLLKALLVHGAAWRKLPEKLLAERPDIQAIENARSRQIAERDFLAQCLGYGIPNIERAITCTAQRATLLGVGRLGAEKGLLFSAPLPPSLAGKVVLKRFTLTLAWLTPVNSAHSAYRRAKLWASAPNDQLGLKRKNSVNNTTAVRGTVQHEIFEGSNAMAFVDGDRFVCKVSCKPDAGELEGDVPFALCISLEVPVASNILLYEEIRDRIQPAIPVNIQSGN